MTNRALRILQGVKLKSGVWNGVFFQKTLIYILFIASIPGLLLGGLMYFIVTGQIERELLTQHEKQILQHAHHIDDQLSYLEISLSHWAFGPDFNESLKKTDFYYNFQATRDMNQNLLTKQGSHPLLYSVEMYINGLKPIVIKPSHTLVEVETLDEIEYYHTLIHNRGTLFWENKGDGGYNSLQLIHTIPVDSPQPFGVMIATLDENKIQAIMKTLTSQTGGTSLLVGEDKHVMVSTSASGDMAELDRLLLNEVFEREQVSGSFVYPWKDNNYSVSYGMFNRINSDWMFISAAPMTAITAPVVFISKTILYVSLAGLLLASTLSLLVSNRIYSPVGRLVQLLRGPSGTDWQQGDEFQFLEEQWKSVTAESSSLRSKMKAQFPLMKEGFLLQLIHGYLGAFSEQEMIDRMSLLGWNMDQQGFIVTHVQLTGLAELEGRFSSKDEELMTFAAANVVEELAKNRFLQAEILNFHDLSFGLLLFIPDGTDGQAEVHQLCDEMMVAVNEILRLRLTITIGRYASSIHRVPHLFQEVKEASIYRDFADRNQVIDLEGIDTALDNAMNYSFALERDLIQYLRMGQKEDAERTIEEFLAALTSGSAKESIVQQGLLQLLGRIISTMLHSGVNPHHLFKGVNMYDRLSQLREADEMLQWMKDEVIAPFIKEMSEWSNDHLRQVVDKAVEYLHEQYMQPDISLDSCAEYAGTNHYSLSRAFKLYTGKNFIEYLTELRIEKAKDLIRDTGLKMYDIAEQVGYRNGYFNRIFKKVQGMTPGQYRELCRK